jgi:FdhE protein
MAKVDLPRHGPVPIGEVADPVFVRLPDPLKLFALRAGRFGGLAQDHHLKPYLLFLAELSRIQHEVQEGLLEPDPPEEAALKQAHDFAMPPLDRGGFVQSAVFDRTLEGVLSRAVGIDMPEAAAVALSHVRSLDASERHQMVRSVLAYSIPMETLAEHCFIAAALQVHFARLAAQLDAASLVAVGDGACPVCGGPPATTLVVGWHGAHGSRYCSCGLCGTLWNYVRIKCVLCGSTKGIGYKEIDGGPGTIKAETCESCRGYVKILHSHKDPSLDCVADDVASLGLDLLMRDAGYKRGGVNPFLVGY